MTFYRRILEVQGLREAVDRYKLISELTGPVRQIEFLREGVKCDLLLVEGESAEFQSGCAKGKVSPTISALCNHDT